MTRAILYEKSDIIWEERYYMRRAIWYAAYAWVPSVDFSCWANYKNITKKETLATVRYLESMGIQNLTEHTAATTLTIFNPNENTMYLYTKRNIYNEPPSIVKKGFLKLSTIKNKHKNKAKTNLSIRNDLNFKIVVGGVGEENRVHQGQLALRKFKYKLYQYLECNDTSLRRLCK